MTADMSAGKGELYLIRPRLKAKSTIFFNFFIISVNFLNQQMYIFLEIMIYRKCTSRYMPFKTLRCYADISISYDAMTLKLSCHMMLVPVQKLHQSFKIEA